MEHLDTYPSKPIDPTAKPSPAVTSDALALDEQLEKKAVRKLDLTVLPVLTMFYLLSFLVSVAYSVARDASDRFLKDRVNIGLLFLGEEFFQHRSN